MKKIKRMYLHHRFLVRMFICSFGLLTLLFAKPSSAGLASMTQVPFSGIDASEGIDATITHRTDLGCNFINVGNAPYSLSNEQIRESLPSNDTLNNNVNLFEISRYAAYIAEHRTLPVGAINFQFDPDDPIFGRVAHATFRYKTRSIFGRYTNIFHIDFEQTRSRSSSHQLLLSIHLREDTITGSGHLPRHDYRLIGVSFNRLNLSTGVLDRYDGFYTSELANILNKIRRENTSAPSGGSSSGHQSKPANQKPPSAGQSDQPGSNKRRFHSSGGGGGGVSVCLAASSIRNAMALMVPIGIQAYIQSNMHSGYTNK